MKKLRQIIALVSFMAFVLIGAFIFVKQNRIKSIVYEKQSSANVEEYYFNAREKTSIGIYNLNNENKILNAKNEHIKDKILKLIKEYNDNKSIDLGQYSDASELLKSSKIKFIGDSNTEHFKFYDVLDDEHYYYMTGKNINEQIELIDAEVLNGVDNLIFFNGYNLDKYNSAEEYIDSYNAIIKKIKDINQDINIYICSLLPATKKAIAEDIESPLPHKIYNGISFDDALENYTFQDAEYIDTKWFMEEDKHKSDGVHMEKYFYDILVPYISYYINLNSDDVEDAASEKIDTHNIKITRGYNAENKVDSIAKKLNNDEYINTLPNDNEIEDLAYYKTDKYFFDVNEELKFFTSICGKDAVANLKNVVFIGDSNAERLVRPLIEYVSTSIIAAKSIRKLEKAYMDSMNFGKKYLVFFTGNNEGRLQTDLKEYKNEYEFISKLIANSNVVEDAFICTYIQLYDTYDKNNNKQEKAQKEYDSVLREVCDECDNLHYIDFTNIVERKYIAKDWHLNYIYNKKALTKIIKYIYEFDKIKHSEDNVTESGDNSISENAIDESDELIHNDKLIKISKDFKEKSFGNINGKDIDWYVVEEDDESMTLLSKNIIMAMPYNEGSEDTTWEKSTIRKYLNKDFLEDTFTSDEREKILVSKIQNNDNDETGTEGGADTEDYAFLLSIDDIKQYFENKNGVDIEKLACRSIDDNISINKNNNKEEWYYKNSPYWLRSPGLYADDASYINFNGSVSVNGINVSYSDIGVRPVIRIKK